MNWDFLYCLSPSENYPCVFMIILISTTSKLFLEFMRLFVILTKIYLGRLPKDKDLLLCIYNLAWVRFFFLFSSPCGPFSLSLPPYFFYSPLLFLLSFHFFVHVWNHYGITQRSQRKWKKHKIPHSLQISVILAKGILLFNASQMQISDSYSKRLCVPPEDSWLSINGCYQS